MADSDPALIGRHACGCITLALANPADPLPKVDADAFARIVAAGGEAIRTTVAEARVMPHFLEGECPHDPKGWTPKPAVDPDAFTVRKRRVAGRHLFVVRLKHRYHPDWRCGEIGRRDGAWWATPGWLDTDKPVARDGRSPAGPAPVLGPFRNQDAAVASITRPALKALIAYTRKRHDEREANPPRRSGPVPSQTSSGKRVPPFRAGETWGHGGSSEYLILDEAEIDPDGGYVRVRARCLDERDEPENLLRPSWTYLHESMLDGMERAEEVAHA